MENNLYEESTRPLIHGQKETNGCLAMALTFGVVTLVTCAWIIYELLTP